MVVESHSLPPKKQAGSVLGHRMEGRCLGIWCNLGEVNSSKNESWKQPSNVLQKSPLQNPGLRPPLKEESLLCDVSSGLGCNGRHCVLCHQLLFPLFVVKHPSTAGGMWLILHPSHTRYKNEAYGKVDWEMNVEPLDQTVPEANLLASWVTCPLLFKSVSFGFFEESPNQGLNKALTLARRLEFQLCPSLPNNY